MSTDDLKIATFLFQNCSMGEKEPNKENKRMNEAEREMKRVLKRQRKRELSESQTILCPLLPQGFCTCNCFYLENVYPWPCSVSYPANLPWLFLNLQYQPRCDFLEKASALGTP